MKTWTLWLLLIVCVGVAASGCVGRAIKEGMGVARGARGVYAPIKAVAPVKEATPLGTYDRFELGKLTDNMGGKVPAMLFQRLPVHFRNELASKRIPNRPTGKTLLIRGQVYHYEDSNVLAFALGPLEQVIARIELVDKSSGTVLGVANCVGRTTESVNVGVDQKAEGLAKAIVSWIDKRYPKDKREK